MGNYLLQLYDIFHTPSALQDFFFTLIGMFFLTFTPCTGIFSSLFSFHNPPPQKKITFWSCLPKVCQFLPLSAPNMPYGLLVNSPKLSQQVPSEQVTYVTVLGVLTIGSSGFFLHKAVRPFSNVGFTALVR